MSTRSLIAYQDPTTKMINAIYCHNNGYPLGVGKCLYQNYQDIIKVKKLIKLGDISILGPNPNQDAMIKKYGFLWDSREFMNLPWEQQLRYSKNHQGTLAYHRDRGEELNIYTCRYLKELKQIAEECDAEFIYLFRKQEIWQWKYTTEKFYKWYDLAQKIRKKKQ